jgi:charged multivesicular body protein 4
MMSGWMANAFGKRDSKQGAREAIVTLREQLALIDKKEEHLERRVEEEHKKAKTLIAANKTGEPFVSRGIIDSHTDHCHCR